MRTVAKIAASVIGLAVAAGSWMAWSFHQPTASAEPFDQAKWLAAGEVADDIGDPGCVRGGMAVTLIGERRLESRTADEVFALLGKPKRIGSEWIYSLGQCSGFGWHDSGLVVRFDSKNRAIAAWFQHSP